MEARPGLKKWGLPGHYINYLKYKGGDTLFCFPHWSGIWRTTNGGENWSLRQSAPGNGDNNTEGITISPVNRNYIYFSAAASGDGFYVSTDGGTSFRKVSKIDRVNAIAAHPDSLGIVWTARYSTLSDKGKGGLWKSTNTGLTWSKKFTLYSYEGYSIPIPNFSGIIYGKTSNVMYACTKDLTPHNGLWLGEGVWKSTDFGEHWTEYNTGIGTKNVTGIAIDRVNNILYISTDSGSTEIRNENYKE